MHQYRLVVGGKVYKGYLHILIGFLYIMKLTIVPEILNSNRIEIKDENHITINLCEQSKFLFLPTFKNPSIIIDNFEKGNDKNPEIKKISLQDLDKIGFRIVSVTANPKNRNYPRQTRLYVLENKNNPYPKAEVLFKIPKEHFLEQDIQNNRIRIKGRNAYPYVRNENASRWVQL